MSLLKSTDISESRPIPVWTNVMLYLPPATAGGALLIASGALGPEAK